MHLCKYLPTLIVTLTCGLTASLQAQTYWAWPTDDDTYSPTAKLDLRSLNEDLAGDLGWVYKEGEKLYFGDGSEARFWSTNLRDWGGFREEQLRNLARMSAKRGVNMVRTLGRVYDLNGVEASSVRTSAIAHTQRSVRAFKESGIYTKLSLYFALTYRLRASWGIEGYDQAWLSSRSNYAPHGLIYFDEKLQEAYKTWVKRVLLDPDPNEPDQTPLAENPAVAMLEIVNEDSLFFYTYVPSNFPEAQRLKQEKMYGDWLTEKYGSVANALAVWGTTAKARDNAAEGRAELDSAGTIGGNAVNKRHADQILFFDYLHRKFYNEITDWLKGPEIGYKGLVIASNWRTASYRFLQDMEYHGYTAADIIDTHFYFTPYISEPSTSGAPSTGKKFFGIPAVNNPRRLPLAVKQVADYPYVISEVAWDSPSNHRAEGPLMIASYAALSGIDGVYWFNSAVAGWESGSFEWQLQVPSVLGQFPAAALIYRKGLVAPATTVVREGRTVESLSKKEKPLLEEYRGFDPLRDSAPPVDPNPANGAGTVDPVASLVGKVEVAYSTDNDYTHSDLAEYIDNETGIIRSVTGELVLDSENGLFTINAPQVRAIVGNVVDAGNVELGNVRLQLRNDFASMVLVSLDDLPIEQSRKLLLQTMGQDRPKGWQTKPATLTRGTQQFEGEEIVSTGFNTGWETENPRGSRLTMITTRPLPRASVLDTNGYVLRNVAVIENTEGFSISAPNGSAYLLLEWDESPSQPPTITTKNLPIGQVGVPYKVTLSALDKDADNLVWALEEVAPEWLTLTPEGAITGTPSESDTIELSISVTGTSGKATAQLQLVVLTEEGLAPTPKTYPTLWADDEYPPYNGLKFATFGWIYDGFFPWVYLFAENSRWLFVPPLSTGDNLWMYDDYEKSWVWTIFQYERFYYSANANEWRVF